MEYTFKGGKYAGQQMSSIMDRGFLLWCVDKGGAMGAAASAQLATLNVTPAPAVAVVEKPAKCLCGGAGFCVYCDDARIAARTARLAR